MDLCLRCEEPLFLFPATLPKDKADTGSLNSGIFCGKLAAR